VRLRAWPGGSSPAGTSTGPAGPGEPDDADMVGWVVHLSVDVPDVQAAMAVAERLCVFAHGVFPQVVAGLTTVSRADHQSVQHHVFCDRILPDRNGRCILRSGHRGECAPR
jgi:hypothetical protein